MSPGSEDDDSRAAEAGPSATAGSGSGTAAPVSPCGAAVPAAAVAASPSASRSPVAPDAWTALRRHTPARIALGRAGASLPTAEVLRLAAAHAEARDAVWLPLDADALEEEFRRAGFATLRAESAAPDRAAYLLRPDLGRRLSDRADAALREQAAAGAAPCDLVLVAADGLSSLAASRHALPLAEAIRAALESAGWTLGPVVIATQARVALGDGIAAALGARMVAMLVGERPGLSSPDSLSAYLTWAPKPGRTIDAERNCVSNIRPGGLDAAQAARKVAWLCEAARRLGATGVALKDDSDVRPAGG